MSTNIPEHASQPSMYAAAQQYQPQPPVYVHSSYYPPQHQQQLPQYHYSTPHICSSACTYLGWPPGLPHQEWNLRSKVSYEVLRQNGYDEALSRCIAGKESGIHPPQSFNKALWNEATAVLRKQYPNWRDENEPKDATKLAEMHRCIRETRLVSERERDDRELQERLLEENQWIPGFQAETRRRLEELSAQGKQQQEEEEEEEEEMAQEAQLSTLQVGPEEDLPPNSLKEDEIAAAAATAADGAEVEKTPEQPVEQNESIHEQSKSLQGGDKRRKDFAGPPKIHMVQTVVLLASKVQRGTAKQEEIGRSRLIKT